MAQTSELAFVFNPDTMQYEYVATGEPVEPELVEGVIADRVDDGNERLLAIMAAVMAGSTLYTLPDFQLAGATELVIAHYQAAIVGAGGLQNMTPAIWKQTAGIVAGELDYWQGLSADIAGGLSEAKARQRVQMYANKIRTSFWNARTETARSNGYTQERRVLNPADHCDDCLAYAAMGWQLIGTLPSPGIGSQCMGNCKCDMEYR